MRMCTNNLHASRRAQRQVLTFIVYYDFTVKYIPRVCTDVCWKNVGETRDRKNERFERKRIEKKKERGRTERETEKLQGKYISNCVRLIAGNCISYQYYVSTHRIMYICRRVVTNIGISAGIYTSTTSAAASRALAFTSLHERHVFCLFPMYYGNIIFLRASIYDISYDFSTHVTSPWRLYSGVAATVIGKHVFARNATTMS